MKDRFEEMAKNAKISIEGMIKSGKIKKGSAEFVDFFLNNSRKSLDSAKLLLKASADAKFQEQIGMHDFDGFLWVINASYYSMFYLIRAMLEKNGIKMDSDDSIHAAVLNALIYYFYANGKLERKIVEDFEDAGEEFLQITGRSKAKDMVEDYLFEKKKRGDFTYGMGMIAMEGKARTSLERAREFSEKIRKMFFADTEAGA